MTLARPQPAELVKTAGERCKTLREMADSRRDRREFAEFDADAAKKHLRPAARQPLEVVRDKLAAISDWTAEMSITRFRQLLMSWRWGMESMPLRVAVTGRALALDVTVHAIGNPVA